MLLVGLPFPPTSLTISKKVFIRFLIGVKAMDTVSFLSHNLFMHFFKGKFYGDYAKLQPQEGIYTYKNGKGSHYQVDKLSWGFSTIFSGVDDFTTASNRNAGQGRKHTKKEQNTYSRPIRIIIIDDNRYFMESLSFILHLKKDLKVVGTNTQARRTLGLIEELKPDVVIMDVMLPDMDGITLLEQIKDRYPDLPVILLSLYDDFKQKALRKGAFAYFIKGENLDLLYQTIRRGAGRMED